MAPDPPQSIVSSEPCPKPTDEAKSPDNTTATALPEGWRSAIDGWVCDPAIRRHALIALAMLLSTPVLIVGLVTGALITAVNILLPSLLAKAIVLGAGGTGLWLHHRRRTRRQSANAYPGDSGLCGR
ncbi:MAG: hypothetical protein ACRDUV_02505 [Pseudonocardiaceae bacterium]